MFDLLAYREAGRGSERSVKGLHSSVCRGWVRKWCLPMIMRDQYLTKAAEFQARALCEPNQMNRFHFESLAKEYSQLAELATKIDLIEGALARQSANA
jgi:hypothetical protein